ncbi:MAG TPA: nucleotidyl transferase AbiEii/AbiGii toxin family protein [Thermoanaerobaculia bacterium]|nr:nucleotidyl transferase AbiEii/AbiGii toxin family protein [Thermoanaerobaculia bacterium]
MTLESQDMEVALRVIETLEDLGLSYHLGGSIASSVHGTPRQTRDIDLAVDLPLSAVAAFVGRLQGEFYLDDERIRSAVQRRSSFNLIHLDTGLKIDIFVRKGEPFDRSEFQRHAPYRLVQDPPRDVMVTSAEDIVLRKLLWYREGNEVSDRQWSDILGVLKAQGERLDQEYLRYWAAELGVDDLLQRALADASD